METPDSKVITGILVMHLQLNCSPKNKSCRERSFFLSLQSFRQLSIPLNKKKNGCKYVTSNEGITCAKTL